MGTTTTTMLKLVLLLSVASLGSALNCQECVREMHSLGFLIKQGSPDIMAYLTANYCPALLCRWRPAHLRGLEHLPRPGGFHHPRASPFHLRRVRGGTGGGRSLHD